MKISARDLHRDLAYFYLGLIISFSLSGIFLNHRQIWHPMDYVYSSKDVTIAVPEDKNLITEEYVMKYAKEWGLEKTYRGFRVREDQLQIRFNDDNVEIDLATGKGQIETYKTTPLLGQMTKLHVDTSNFWIYYSDIFGIAMLTIAITGMFIAKGSNSYRSRGWKLGLGGIIFPLIFLFVLA